MFKWAMGALCAVMACAPVGAAQTVVYRGFGDSYYSDPYYTPPGVPDPIAITFFAVFAYEPNSGNVDNISYARYEVRRSDNGSFLAGETFPTDDGRLNFIATDTFFYFSPGHLAPGYYGYGTVTFVDRTGVPEPATWAMLIVGFGAVGAVARRRRPAFA